MKRPDALELVALLQAAYPRHEWPDPTVALFAEELARLAVPREVAHGSIRRMLRERVSDFPPSLAELLQTIAVDADQAPSFDRAWNEMAALATRGSYFHPDEPPAFSHPAITRLALGLGWRNFRMSNTDDQFFRRSAERLYGAILEDRIAGLLDEPAALAAMREERELPAPMRELVSGIGGEG